MIENNNPVEMEEKKEELSATIDFASASALDLAERPPAI